MSIWLYGTNPLGFGVVAFLLGVTVALSHLFGTAVERFALTGTYRLQTTIVVASSAVIGGSIMYVNLLGGYGAYVPGYLLVAAVMFLLLTATLLVKTVRATPARLPRFFYAIAFDVALGCFFSVIDMRYLLDVYAFAIAASWCVIIGTSMFGALIGVKKYRRARRTP